MIEEKHIANVVYHSAVISGLSIVYAMIGKKILKSSIPKLDISPYDAGMVILDNSATLTKDFLVKQKDIPADIMKVIAKLKNK